MTPTDSPGLNMTARVCDSFARQNALAAIGAEVSAVAAGEVEIVFPFRAEFSQQHGFLHGGIVATVLDSACGYAALTLMPPESEVLTVEFKVNFTRPASGERFIARGKVASHGKRILVTSGSVHGIQQGQEKLVATMMATMIQANP